MNKLVFKTRDNPTANDKQPKIGDVQYDVWFPLENGEELHVLLGEEGMRNLRNVVLAELCDDELVTGN